MMTMHVNNIGALLVENTDVTLDRYLCLYLYGVQERSGIQRVDAISIAGRYECAHFMVLVYFAMLQWLTAVTNPLTAG